MSSKCKKCCQIISQKLFRLINILIDLMFGIFHYFVKREDWYLRYASVVKFISSAIFNTLDMFQVRCCCCCCCLKESSQEDLDEMMDDETMVEELDKKTKDLLREKTILKRILDGNDKTSQNYSNILSKIKRNINLQKENNGYIKLIIA